MLARTSKGFLWGVSSGLDVECPWFMVRAPVRRTRQLPMNPPPGPRVVPTRSVPPATSVWRYQAICQSTRCGLGQSAPRQFMARAHARRARPLSMSLERRAPTRPVGRHRRAETVLGAPIAAHAAPQFSTGFSCRLRRRINSPPWISTGTIRMRATTGDTVTVPSD